jgi:hypothetical protein
LKDVTKYVARAKIVNPSAVATRCSAEGGVAHAGAIYCEIPEMGFFEPNLVYCRYGLSIPYLKVQAGQTLLVEPSVDGEGRWFYVGFADCGGGITPADADQMYLQLLSQVIYASTAGKIHLSSKTAAEAFVLGNQLNTYLTNLVSAINLALGTKADSAGSPGTLTAPSGILSTKIMGE